MKYFEYKSIKAEVKDVNTEKGIITGYFSAFDSLDSDNDVIVKGAFSKTLQENGKRIKHLWQHDVRYPLSKPTELKEDNYGLYFESKISQTSYGKDVLKLYQDGVIDEHSIGFRTIKNADKKDYNEIQEVKLWEGSTVTFGANPNTPFLGMKGMGVEDVISKMDGIYKALKNGTFENEEIFENLEIYHNQLKQYLNEITAPVVETVQPKSEVDTDLVLAQIFLTQKSLLK
jgi:HK97 family phage prohead protease